ncbi:MAG: TIGR04255 family protein, partial [Proteobacteria bacterium]|nr:TIGR04255 family protein [Pseudomonadota bacterium]
MTANYLRNGPLTVCSAVFRFSPIELMGKEYIASIQDVFRKQGLPKFTEQESVEIGNKGERKFQVQWLFSSYDDSELVVIGTSSVTYQTFVYSHFQAFKERLLKLFGLFCTETDFYHGTVLNFFGLRYANAIEGGDWKEYLSSSYHGIVFPQNLVVA